MVRRTIALVRAGALRSLAKHGLPATLACSSACSADGGLWVTSSLARGLRAHGRSVRGGQQGLPRGTRYVPLGIAAARRTRAGAVDFTLPVGTAVRGRLPRLTSAAARITALAGGPGTDPRSLGWPLVLPR